MEEMLKVVGPLCPWALTATDIRGLELVTGHDLKRTTWMTNSSVLGSVPKSTCSNLKYCGMCDRLGILLDPWRVHRLRWSRIWWPGSNSRDGYMSAIVDLLVWRRNRRNYGMRSMVDSWIRSEKNARAEEIKWVELADSFSFVALERSGFRISRFEVV